MINYGWRNIVIETVNIKQQTLNWVKTVVVKHNFCPFAAAVLNDDSLRILVAVETDIESALSRVSKEWDFLESNPDTETALVVFPSGFSSFETFLDLSGLAGELANDLGYRGVYQVADFHPEYCFDGCETDDPANYTNRSPWPTLHLIRESSIERAIRQHQDPDSIPQTNIDHCRKHGQEFFQEALKNCKLDNTA